MNARPLAGELGHRPAAGVHLRELPHPLAPLDLRLDHGPFDTSVYRARDALLAKGYLQADNGGRYASYTLTDAGAVRVRELEQDSTTTR